MIEICPGINGWKSKDAYINCDDVRHGAEMAEYKDGLILIIESDASLIASMKHTISEDGFRITAAENGIQAIQEIKKSIPDLVLLDIMLPEKNGYEIIKSLQGSEHRHIPVIIIAGELVEEFYKKVLLAEPNVKEFITKPIKPQALLDSMHKLVKTIPPEQKKVQEKKVQEKKPLPEKDINPWKIEI